MLRPAVYVKVPKRLSEMWRPWASAQRCKGRQLGQKFGQENYGFTEFVNRSSIDTLSIVVD